MYYKGANVLHTLRHLVEDDEKWRSILRDMNQDFYHQTVTSNQIENYLSLKTGKDLAAFFEQYLRTTMVPTLEYEFDGKKLKYRYTNVVEDFDMPVRVWVDNKEHWLFPKKSSAWKTDKVKGESLVVDRNFYINSKKI